MKELNVIHVWLNVTLKCFLMEQIPSLLVAYQLHHCKSCAYYQEYIIETPNPLFLLYILDTKEIITLDTIL